MTNQWKQTITIEHMNGIQEEMTPDAMAAQAGSVFPLAERIEGGAGEAFDFIGWYMSWRRRHNIEDSAPLPTHLKVEAADSFEAFIPWAQLRGAAFQFAQGGQPLVKGGPVRLYAPNGSSDCLNVKSVVVCRFIADEDQIDNVSYGFKNTFSPQELRKKS